MHAPLVTLALLSTSALALQGTLSSPRSYGAMLPRANAMSKRQGYYPESTLCNGDGTTCAEVCGADTEQCTSNDTTMLSCHSVNDGSHCCTDGTGNACGPGDYCTNDGAGQTYCCPENLNAADCAKAFGIDVTLIPDAPTGVSAPSPSAGVPSANPTPVESAPSSSAAVVVPSPSPSPSSKSVAVVSSKTVPSETPLVPTAATKSSVATPSKAPNATTTGSASLPQFTGGAAKLAGAGAAVVGAVVGLAVL